MLHPSITRNIRIPVTPSPNRRPPHPPKPAAVAPISDAEEEAAEQAITSAYERLSIAKKESRSRGALAVHLAAFEEQRLRHWVKRYGKVGFIYTDAGENVDGGGGGGRPKDIFDAADSRLKALVSLGVMAGLLAGTAVSTISLISDNLLGDWVYALSLCSSICSISAALLISYHYFNGAKLLSLGHLTVEFFTVRTEDVKSLCVRCFFVATLTQSLSFVLITMEKMAAKGDSLVRALPFVLVLAFSVS
jgi:hypothetical protein